jgi:hypothetical protein
MNIKTRFISFFDRLYSKTFHKKDCFKLILRYHFGYNEILASSKSKCRHLGRSWYKNIKIK